VARTLEVSSLEAVFFRKLLQARWGVFQTKRSCRIQRSVGVKGIRSNLMPWSLERGKQTD
jgi:hypothetical protein